jgi:hypothetical protein
MGERQRKGTARPRGKKRRRSPALAKPTRLAQRVYDWEAEWYHWNTEQFNTIHGPRKWVHWALDAYKVPHTVVRPRRGHDHSFFRPHDWSISLLRKHRNLASALHEAAHAIHAYYYGPVDEYHDAKWLGIFVWLLGCTTAWPKEAITASLKARGLTYSHMMTPDVLKHKKPYGK